MIELGLLLAIAIGGFLGFTITQSFVSQRHWRRVIREGDLDALHAALLEALDTWRRMRPPYDVVPADWRALQSAELVAADTRRCRVSLLAEPDIRVIEGLRTEVGPPLDVARRAAVTMAERLLYEIPLCRFGEVQIDVYTEYRSAGGEAASECLLTTRLDRDLGARTDWDELDSRAILESWTTRERADAAAVDPERGALITVAEAHERAPQHEPAAPSSNGVHASSNGQHER